MKTFLLPVSPMEAMRILNGKQTIIIRKSVPNDELPMKVWLYCSDSKDFLLDKDRNYFVWDKHEHHYFYRYEEEPKEHYFQKKVVANFTLRKIDKIPSIEPFGNGRITDKGNEIIDRSCLTLLQIMDYLEFESGYALYVSDLQILDKPKKPSEFKCRRNHLNVSRVRGPYMYVEE